MDLRLIFAATTSKYFTIETILFSINTTNMSISYSQSIAFKQKRVLNNSCLAFLKQIFWRVLFVP